MPTKCWLFCIGLAAELRSLMHELRSLEKIFFLIFTTYATSGLEFPSAAWKSLHWRLSLSHAKRPVVQGQHDPVLLRNAAAVSDHVRPLANAPRLHQFDEAGYPTTSNDQRVRSRPTKTRS